MHGIWNFEGSQFIFHLQVMVQYFWSIKVLNAEEENVISLCYYRQVYISLLILTCRKSGKSTCVCKHGFSTTDSFSLKLKCWQNKTKRTMILYHVTYIYTFLAFLPKQPSVRIYNRSIAEINGAVISSIVTLLGWVPTACGSKRSKLCCSWERAVKNKLFTAAGGSGTHTWFPLISWQIL